MVKVEFDGVEEFITFSLSLQEKIKEAESAQGNMVKNAVLNGAVFNSNYLDLLDATKDNDTFEFGHEVTLDYQSMLRGKASVTLTNKVGHKDTQLLLDFNYKSMAMGFSVFLDHLYSAMSDGDKRIAFRRTEIIADEELIELGDLKKLVSGNDRYDFKGVRISNADEGEVVIAPSRYWDNDAIGQPECYRCIIDLNTMKEKAIQIGQLFDRSFYNNHTMYDSR